MQDSKRRRLKPMQLDFIKNYTSPSSDTYSNAVQSAVRAGYTLSYAQSHAHRRLVPLISEKISQKENRIISQATKHEKMLAKAEENLQKDLDITDDEGPTMRALRNKTTTFIAETVGKATFSKHQALNTVHVALVSDNTLQALEATMVDALGTTPHVDTPVYTIDEVDGDADLLTDT